MKFENIIGVKTRNWSNTCVSLIEHKVALTVCCLIGRWAFLLEPIKKFVAETCIVWFCSTYVKPIVNLELQNKNSNQGKEYPEARKFTCGNSDISLHQGDVVSEPWFSFLKDTELLGLPPIAGVAPKTPGEAKTNFEHDQVVKTVNFANNELKKKSYLLR